MFIILRPNQSVNVPKKVFSTHYIGNEARFVSLQQAFWRRICNNLFDWCRESLIMLFQMSGGAAHRMAHHGRGTARYSMSDDRYD